MKALPDEEGIETQFERFQSVPGSMKALPDEEGIETYEADRLVSRRFGYEGTP